MSLFQKTVLKEFVKAQNQAAIADAYAKFQAHFGDLAIQQNILQALEIQYQEGFLNDLFVNILGYTLNPQPNYNLITEQKNETDSKKADGAILKEGKVVGVIELKDTKTVDLQNVESQAFRYKNAHQNCRYVITSNFKDLRFYLDSIVEPEKFDLFNLDLERFKVLYTLLHYKNIAKDLPFTLKEKSIQREEEITLAFYNDYEAFRESLFRNIAHLNRQYDKFLLFQKTQKLLDRIVFMCFAEDKGLLPANLIHTIISEWENGRAEGRKETLYDRFKAHFEFINTGFQSTKYDIYPYNGGLFAHDEVLDNLQIDDKNLRSRSEGLSSYNFDSDVDTNVLGHIFEHSLNQLEKKRAELIEDIENEKNGTKKESKPTTQRKTDGIFYTPLYITNYIIEETLGKLCTEKKQALDWENLTIEKINEYRDWLLTIKVLDPACGSGAFLNQVLNFFITEHQKIDELAYIVSQTKVSFDLTHQILENNIFGVDINFESVSITKLSLWLRIAQDKRKLNDLSENIKQGNSLIDDKSIDERAFDWKKEFPKVIEGFDLIVGNPPYVSANNMNFQQRQYFNKSEQYKHLQGKWDLFVPFFERALSLLKIDGILSFIVPYGLLNQPFATNLRKWILDEFSLRSIVDLHEAKVFAEATIPTCIPIIHKTQNLFTSIDILKHKVENKNHVFYVNHQIELEKYRSMENFMFRTEKLDQSFDLLGKIKAVGTQLGELFYVSTGAEIHGKEQRNEGGLTSGYSKFDVLHEKMATGFKSYIEGSAIPKSRQLGRYCFPLFDYYLDYDANFERMRSPKFKELFESPKIIVRRSSGATGILATYDERKIYTSEKCLLMISKNNLQKRHSEYQEHNQFSLKYLLALLNSKLMHFYYTSVYSGFIDVYPNYLKSLPIPASVSAEIEAQIVEKVDILLLAHQSLAILGRNFIKVLKSQFGLEKPSEKLTLWYKLEWETFTKEMKKAKSEIPTRKEFEWIGLFEEKRSEALGYLSQIETTEKLLDTMIYALYNLTPKEIKIIENG